MLLSVKSRSLKTKPTKWCIRSIRWPSRRVISDRGIRIPVLSEFAISFSIRPCTLNLCSLDSSEITCLVLTRNFISKWYIYIYIYIHTYMFVVNFDALAQASDIRIERRQVVFLCWRQDSNPRSQIPIHQQTECLLTNRLSYRGSS